MAKVVKAFKACINGEVYPRSFEVGDVKRGAILGHRNGCTKQL